MRRGHATAWLRIGWLLVLCTTVSLAGLAASGDASSDNPFEPTLQLVALGGAEITSHPAGITCGHGSTRCSARFVAGTWVKLTVKPGPHEQLVRWNWNACPRVISDRNPPCDVQVNGDMTITALVCGMGRADLSAKRSSDCSQFSYPADNGIHWHRGSGQYELPPPVPTGTPPPSPSAREPTVSASPLAFTYFDVLQTEGGTVAISPGRATRSGCARSTACYEVSGQAKVQIRAEPNRGWVFRGWKSGCPGRHVSCTYPAYDAAAVLSFPIRAAFVRG